MNEADVILYERLCATLCAERNPYFGFVSGAPNEFFVSGSAYKIFWNRLQNTVKLPDVDYIRSLEADAEAEDEYPVNANPRMITPSTLISKLKRGSANYITYYVPTSPEDAFQAETVLDGEVLPFELVGHLDAVLESAKNSISKYTSFGRN